METGNFGASGTADIPEINPAITRSPNPASGIVNLSFEAKKQ